MRHGKHGIGHQLGQEWLESIDRFFNSPTRSQATKRMRMLRNAYWLRVRGYWYRFLPHRIDVLAPPGFTYGQWRP